MTKSTKKARLLFMLFAAVALFLAACGSDDTSEETSDDAATDTDVVASASISDQPEDLIAGLSEDGNWIFAVTDDVTLSDDLVVAGTFYDGNDESADVYRKLALYAQDDEHNVTDEYTLTVPTIIVESPNFRIQNGTVEGNIEVSAEGFELAGSTVNGDVTFDSQELLDSANLDEGTVTGEVTVAE